MVVTAKQHSDELAGLGVPQADRPVGGPAGQHVSVRGKSEAADRIRMAPQNPEHPAGLHLPDPDRMVYAGAGRHRAVWMVRHYPDRVVVSAEDAGLAGAGSPVGQAIHDGDRRDPRHYRAIGHRNFPWKSSGFPWLAKERGRYL